MPDDKLPIPQFAAKIKAKYPEYKDVNDTLLVEKILAKYPEYEASVDMSGLKKKEPQPIVSQPLSEGAPTISGGLAAGLKPFASAVQLPSTTPKEKYKPESVEQYNQKFETLTGHKPFSLSEPEKPTTLLGQERYQQKKKQFEENKYLQYRDIEEKEIKPVLTEVEFGTVKPENLSELYNKPYGKKIVSDVINTIAPEAGSMALEKDTFGAEQKWQNIANVINLKQRPKGVEAQNQYLYNLDNELYNDIKNLQTQNVSAQENRQTGQKTVYSTNPFPKINTNSPDELSTVLTQLQGSDEVVDKRGNVVPGARDKMIKQIDEKLFFLAADTPVHPEINSISDKTAQAIARVNMARERGEFIDNTKPLTDEVNQKHFEKGLTYLKYAKPGQYQNIIKGITERGTIAGLDFEQVAGIGQQLYNQQIFKESAANPELIGKETNLRYDSYDTKKAEYSRVLSEELKKMGYKNIAKIPQSAIDKAAAKHPELTNREIIGDIKLDEAAGGYGIVKGGGLTAIMRGLAKPIKFFNETVNARIESPVDNYLNSRRLDYGDQKLFDEQGNIIEKLPSEKRNYFNNALEGLGQFITQIAFSRGIGSLGVKGVNVLMGNVPRAALTSAQKLNLMAYGGGGITTFAQTYGPEYIDFLNKTGNPEKASFMAGVSSLAQSVIEVGILPDVKVVEGIKEGLKNPARKLAQGIVEVIEKGGKKEGITPLVKGFVGNLTKFYGKEILGEEVLQNVTNYLTEAIASPSTVKDRNLIEETGDVIEQATVSFAIPTILGAVGKTKIDQKITKDAIHSGAINFESYKDAFDKSLINGSITEQEHKAALDILQSHKESIANAPKRDANNEPISAERQLEYAFHDTIAKINEVKANEATDKVQKEFYTEKAKEADGIKRKIFYGEESKELPAKVEEEIKVKDEAPPTPEQIIIQEAEKGTLAGGYSGLVMQNPSMAKDVLLDYAKQKYGLTEDGTEVEGGGREITNKEVDKAVTQAFPTKQSVVDAIKPIQPPPPEVSTVSEEVTTQEQQIDMGKGIVEDVIKKGFDKTNNYSKFRKVASDKDIEIKLVPLSEIEKYVEVNREINPKAEDYAINELAKSIKIEGWLEPIQFNYDNEKGRIAEGNTRIEAAKLLGLKEIPVWFNKTKDAGKNYEGEEMSLIEFTKKDLPSETTQETQEVTPPPSTQQLADKGEEVKRKVKEAEDEVRAAFNDFKNLGAIFDPKNQAEKNVRLTNALINYVKAKLEQGAYTVKEFIQDIKNAFGVEVDQEGADYIFKKSGAKEPPPKPPKEEKKEGSKGKMEEKGILNRLYKAKKVPEASKKGFEEEGLEYETKSQPEAQQLASAIIDEFGIDEAVGMAEAQKFDGDVNSLIFGESLNRLSELETKAKDPEEQLDIAKRFADIGITYDKIARYGGRFNAAINYFYKKSPLGVVIMENARRKNDFDQWAKPKNKSWKEAFEDMMQDPEFAEVVREKIKEELRKERKESRAKRIAKVRDIFRRAKDQFKGGAAYSTIIPPPIINAALDLMEKGYEAGEAIAAVVQEAIDYISDKLGNAPWDKEKFRKEWEEKLRDAKTSEEQYKDRLRKQIAELDEQIAAKKRKYAPKEAKEYDEETKALIKERDEKKKELVRVAGKFHPDQVLAKIRKKLNGLNEKQQRKVIEKSYLQLIENGGLEYDDFKKIIAEVIGRGELTPDQIARMKELVEQQNSVQKAAKELIEKRTPEALKKFREAEKIGGRAARELNELFYNKPDILKRLVSITQLSTLGAVALVANVVYNLWQQAALRFPIGIINTLIDFGASVVARVTGKTYEQENNIITGQGEFWNKMGLGIKESIEQIKTGLSRMDYTQKELYGQQIRPRRAWKDIFAYFGGKRPLTTRQFWDKFIQGTVGVPAEIVARLLNVGDKPLRFAAEGAQAGTFAKALGLTDMDYKLFVEFPREEAYRAYKAMGLSDQEAGQKADYIKEAIVKEGQRATFQQDNLFNDIITRGASVLGGKESGTAGLAKMLVVSPYIKIPSNAFWSFYNLANPEVAILQAIIHAGRAKSLRSQGENTKANLADREGRYWLAHAVTGIAFRAVVLSLAAAGKFNPSSDEDDSKKERDAMNFFERGGTTNIGGYMVSNRWLGPLGMLGNLIAKQDKELTAEQRQNRADFWEIVFGGMELEALSELESGIFANSSSLLQSLNSGDFSRYGTNTLNLFANIIQPAAFAQINRAALDEVPQVRGDNFLEKLNQNFAQRSTIYRNIFNVQLTYKRDIWGQRIPKGGNILSRMFGISKGDPQLFGRPLYEDFMRTADSGFLPPAVLPVLGENKLNTEQYDRILQYIGSSRKTLIEPYINNALKIPGFEVRYNEMKSDEDKKFVLGSLFELGRQEGLDKFYKDYPELRPAERPTDYAKEVQKDIFNLILGLQTKYK